MSKERLMIVLGLLINTLIVFVKIFGGIVFCSYTVMVDGYYTLINMSHEFIAFISSVVRGRRASQKEPFGFGKTESISHMLFGIFLCLLAIYIFIKTFFLNFEITDIRILLVLLFVILFKILLANYNFSIAKETQSEMLMAVSHHSFFEGVISIVSIIFVVLSSIWPYFDLIGSLLLSIIIYIKGLKIIIDNVLLIQGQNDKSKKVNDSIKKILNNFTEIKYSNCNLTNYNNFYKATIEILVDENLVISDLIKYEGKIKKLVKRKNLKIKMVEFEVYKK